MKIKTIIGDISQFPGDIDIICQGCNTLNVMGAGLAKQLSRDWPIVKAVDDLAAEYGINVLGNYSVANIMYSDKPRQIYNLYQQEQLGAGSLNYVALFQSIDAMIANVSKLKMVRDSASPSIGFPYKIGCGLAGGNWNMVLDYIERIAEKYDGEIYIVQLP